MKQEEFEGKVKTARARVDELSERLALGPEGAVPEVFEELRNALEELQVAEEELRAQNEELVTSRAALEEERRRYQELFDFAPDGYLVTDPAGIIREANQALAAMLGRPASRLVGKPLALFVAQADRQALHTQLGRLRRAERIADWEARLLPRRGEPLPASATLAGVRDAQGALVGVRWLVRDITERKRAEGALRQAYDELEEARGRIEELARREQKRADWLAAILDQLPAGVVIVSADGRIVLVNRAVERLWGLRAEKVRNLTGYGESWWVEGPEAGPWRGRTSPFSRPCGARRRPPRKRPSWARMAAGCPSSAPPCPWPRAGGLPGRWSSSGTSASRRRRSAGWRRPPGSRTSSCPWPPTS